MDISFDLIRKIISSDELCDKVNLSENSDSYLNALEDYVFSLCNSYESVKVNIVYINRFLRKFVINRGSKEDIFFNRVLLSLYKYDIKDSSFNDILNDFDFHSIKNFLVQRYDQNVINNSSVSREEIVKMLLFYCFVCPNYLLPISHVNYFVFNLLKYDISISSDLVCYFYRMFSLCISNEKNMDVDFCVSDSFSLNDPYYDRRNKIVVYSKKVGNKLDCSVLFDIFFQRDYLYLLKCINEGSNYSFEQLELVKELCLISIYDRDYFESNYGDISFSNYLRKKSFSDFKDYLSGLKLDIDISYDYDVLSVSLDVLDDKDKASSIDLLFDLTLENENPNLLRELIKNYPILGCEYKSDKRKSLLNLLLDIYSNRKLLANLNKDLNWYNMKLSDDSDSLVLSRIERLENKIKVCSSYISVMSHSINSCDMTSSDILRSISDLITYKTNDVMIQNDIFSILNSIVPKKIESLCFDRSDGYKNQLKSRIIKCFIDSMSLVRNDFEINYFMRIYSCLNSCIKVID